MNKIIRNTALLLILASVSAQLGLAQPTTYSGALGYPSFVINNGGFAGTYYNVPVASAGMQALVDPTALTVQFQNFQFQTQPTTLTRTISITAGFGVTKDFTLTLNLNALTLQFSDGGVVHGLSPTTGGSYSILGGGGVAAYTDSLFTGSYTVAGPTQTETGTFSVSAADSRYMIIPNTLNTLGYPSQLTFSHSSSQYYTSLDSYQAPKLFINTVVDGEVIQWGFSQMQFSANFGSTSPGQLAAIPEPSTYAAILAGISLVITLAWKRFRRAQPQGVE